MGDTDESLAAQDFIASQYPPMEEAVSSSERLGRALVSGALGRKIDDPKMFETVVNLKECTVVLQSTRKKSKVPVSAVPPNSMESEMDMDESGSVHLSQSATDVGVHIGLPEVEIDLEIQQTIVEPDTVLPMEAEDTDVPQCTGTVSTPVLMPSETTHRITPVAPSDTEAKETHVGEIETSTSERALATNPVQSQKMLREIRSAQLLHEELMMRDPTIATATSFMSTVCGGRVDKIKPDMPKEMEIKKSAVAKSILSDVAQPLMSAEVIE